MLNETLRKCKCSRKFLQNKIKYCFVCNQKLKTMYLKEQIIIFTI